MKHGGGSISASGFILGGAEIYDQVEKILNSSKYQSGLIQNL